MSSRSKNSRWRGHTAYHAKRPTPSTIVVIVLLFAGSLALVGFLCGCSTESYKNSKLTPDSLNLGAQYDTKNNDVLPEVNFGWSLK